jgi:hypothetical protein
VTGVATERHISRARRGDGRVEVRDGFSISFQCDVLIFVVLQERHLVISEEGLHVPTEVAGIGRDRRELVAGSDGVVPSGSRGESKLDSLIELLR